MGLDVVFNAVTVSEFILRGQGKDLKTDLIFALHILSEFLANVLRRMCVCFKGVYKMDN